MAILHRFYCILAIIFSAGEEDEDEDIQFDGSGFISAMQEMFGKLFISSPT